MKLRRPIAALVLVLVLIIAAVVYVSTDNSSTHRGRELSLDAGREARELTAPGERSLKHAALADPLVRRLTDGGDPKPHLLMRWTSEDASQLLGAGIYVQFDPAISLRHQRLPFYLTPVLGAPPDTPYQHRTRVMSATGVTELKVRVLLKGKEVVEVEPLGPKIHVSSARILGPPPGAAYIPKGG